MYTAIFKSIITYGAYWEQTIKLRCKETDNNRNNGSNQQHTASSVLSAPKFGTARSSKKRQVATGALRLREIKYRSTLNTYLPSNTVQKMKKYGEIQNQSAVSAYGPNIILPKQLRNRNGYGIRDIIRNNESKIVSQITADERRRYTYCDTQVALKRQESTKRRRWAVRKHYDGSVKKSDSAGGACMQQSIRKQTRLGIKISSVETAVNPSKKILVDTIWEKILTI